MTPQNTNQVEKKKLALFVTIFSLIVAFVFWGLSFHIFDLYGNKVDLLSKIIFGLISLGVFFVIFPLYLLYIFDLKPLPVKKIFSIEGFNMTAESLGGKYAYVSVLIMLLSSLSLLFSFPLFLLSADKLFVATFVEYLASFVVLGVFPSLVVAFWERRKLRKKIITKGRPVDRKFKITIAGGLFIFSVILFQIGIDIQTIIKDINNFIH